MLCLKNEFIQWNQLLLQRYYLKNKEQTLRKLSQENKTEEKGVSL
jgi:hypothetical protein